MKQLFNYCPVHGYEQEIMNMPGGLTGYLQKQNLQGVELYLFHGLNYQLDYRDHCLGVHLQYWPYWLDLWHDDRPALTRNFSSKKDLHTYYAGATTAQQWLEVIRENIRTALKLHPEYLVWHVANCDFAELFTFNFHHTNEQVMVATAKVFNQIAQEIPASTMVLFENLWWPGLQQLKPGNLRNFFNALSHGNTGLILDTGHLMNTNWQLATEAQGVAFICRQLQQLGELRTLIRGMHLSCSLSGTYQQACAASPCVSDNKSEIMRHVLNMDQHRAFRRAGLAKIFEIIQPQYLVHELHYDNLADLAKGIRQQQKLLLK